MKIKKTIICVFKVIVVTAFIGCGTDNRKNMRDFLVLKNKTNKEIFRKNKIYTDYIRVKEVNTSDSNNVNINLSYPNNRTISITKEEHDSLIDQNSYHTYTHVKKRFPEFLSNIKDIQSSILELENKIKLSNDNDIKDHEVLIERKKKEILKFEKKIAQYKQINNNLDTKAFEFDKIKESRNKAFNLLEEYKICPKILKQKIYRLLDQLYFKLKFNQNCLDINDIIHIGINKNINDYLRQISNKKQFFIENEKSYSFRYYLYKTKVKLDLIIKRLKGVAVEIDILKLNSKTLSEFINKIKLFETKASIDLRNLKLMKEKLTQGTVLNDDTFQNLYTDVKNKISECEKLINNIMKNMVSKYYTYSNSRIIVKKPSNYTPEYINLRLVEMKNSNKLDLGILKFVSNISDELIYNFSVIDLLEDEDEDVESNELLEIDLSKFTPVLNFPSYMGLKYDSILQIGCIINKRCSSNMENEARKIIEKIGIDSLFYYCDMLSSQKGRLFLHNIIDEQENKAKDYLMNLGYEVNFIQKKDPSSKYLPISQFSIQKTTFDSNKKNILYFVTNNGYLKRNAFLYKVSLLNTEFVKICSQSNVTVCFYESFSDFKKLPSKLNKRYDYIILIGHGARNHICFSGKNSPSHSMYSSELSGKKYGEVFTALSNKDKETNIILPSCDTGKFEWESGTCISQYLSLYLPTNNSMVVASPHGLILKSSFGDIYNRSSKNLLEGIRFCPNKRIYSTTKGENLNLLNN